jgi:hypothetical protein
MYEVDPDFWAEYPANEGGSIPDFLVAVIDTIRDRIRANGWAALPINARFELADYGATQDFVNVLVARILGGRIPPG